MNKLLSSLFATATLSTVVSCTFSDPEPPNIVLISIDTLRWDYLGVYGYEEPGVSPAIDWLAENGIVFDQAVASAGTTGPSHGTMLTGLYPRHHGARSNHHGLYPNIATIAQALSEANYQTGAFVSVKFMGRLTHLTRGFKVDNMPELTGQKTASPQAGVKTIAQAAQWLGSLDRERPAFLFLHLWEVHTPFEPSDWSRSRSTAYDGFLNSGLGAKQFREKVEELRDSPEHLSALQALYAGEVNRVDEILGRFFEEWQARGFLDNSVIIFTADHGERLGENGRFGHGPTHDEHVIRVPLIIADFRNPAHQRITTRVGTIDIAPTLAELAGLEKRFDRFGYSLLDEDALDAERPYFAEVALRTSQLDPEKLDQPWYDPNAVAVWVGDLKLKSSLGQLSLLETNSDNRLPDPLDLGSEAIMVNYMSGLIDNFREAPLDLTESDLSEAELEELRGLGYIQ